MGLTSIGDERKLWLTVGIGGFSTFGEAAELVNAIRIDSPGGSWTIDLQQYLALSIVDPGDPPIASRLIPIADAATWEAMIGADFLFSVASPTASDIAPVEVTADDLPVASIRITSPIDTETITLDDLPLVLVADSSTDSVTFMWDSHSQVESFGVFGPGGHLYDGAAIAGNSLSLVGLVPGQSYSIEIHGEPARVATTVEFTVQSAQAP